MITIIVWFIDLFITCQSEHFTNIYYCESKAWRFFNIFYLLLLERRKYLMLLTLSHSFLNSVLRAYFKQNLNARKRTL